MLCPVCEILHTQMGKINLQTDHRGIARDHSYLTVYTELLSVPQVGFALCIKVL